MLLAQAKLSRILFACLASQTKCVLTMSECVLLCGLCVRTLLNAEIAEDDAEFAEKD